VALPLAGRWYPAEKQGFVLGLVGAGNGGTVAAALVAPPLLALVGWRDVFALAALLVVLVLVAFALLAREMPARATVKPIRHEMKVLRCSEAYWHGAFYAITFGGFLGITGFLTILFRDQYEVDPGRAGLLAALCALIGSLMRPIGGLLADRLGGTSVLFLTYLGLGVLGLRMSYLPHVEVAVLSLVLLLVVLGMGNGAVFQMVSVRFRDELGAAMGLVGALGGLGGLALSALLGYSREWFGTFGPAFYIAGLSGLLAAGLLIQASRRWQPQRTAALGSRPARPEVEVMAQS
jgi:NNP family nitrate/nitrite transporter-like MFS transporter